MRLQATGHLESPIWSLNGSWWCVQTNWVALGAPMTSPSSHPLSTSSTSPIPILDSIWYTELLYTHHIHIKYTLKTHYIHIIYTLHSIELHSLYSAQNSSSPLKSLHQNLALSDIAFPNRNAGTLEWCLGTSVRLHVNLELGTGRLALARNLVTNSIPLRTSSLSVYHRRDHGGCGLGTDQQPRMEQKRIHTIFF